MALRARVNQRDVQGNVLCGYGNAFGQALYAFAHVSDGGAGRRWLDELARKITNAVPWGTAGKPTDTLNVALTYEGLAALGVPEGILASFPEEFRAGMAARAELLGDTGRSDPEEWDRGLRRGRPHVLVTITAREPCALARRRAWLHERVAAAQGGVALIHEQEAALLDHPAENQFGREHFGFADGLAQPQIADRKAGPNDRPGQGTPASRGRWKDVAPGEFVLGYGDEDGVEADAPAEPLRLNGTFTVVRKLHQDVAQFTQFLTESAERLGQPEALLAAKIVGRWRDGTPLVRSPGGPDAEYAPGGKLFRHIDDFRYDGDADGGLCPIGAHVRRANPRDALGWHGSLTKRHRIIRRGMPYGPPPEDPAVPDGKERGLMFVCYQASIARQFEVIQARWLNDGDAFGLGDDKDLLTPREPAAGKMTIQGSPPTFLSPRRSFVTTKGGGYFFTPGIAAVRALARGFNGGG